ncbi:MAG: hypothetical protein ACOCQD_03765 [archaeon]
MQSHEVLQVSNEMEKQNVIRYEGLSFDSVVDEYEDQNSGIYMKKEIYRDSDNQLVVYDYLNEKTYEQTDGRGLFMVYTSQDLHDFAMENGRPDLLE